MLNERSARLGLVARLAAGIGRRPKLALVVVLLYGAAAQIAILFEAWNHNVFARQLIGDAAYYWDWAGRIAAGEWAPDHPFLAAPLYPYFLALLRGFGASLPIVYATQVLLWLVSAAMIGLAAGRLSRPVVTPFAAALFVLSCEPAYMNGRVLSAELQVFFLAWLAWELSAWKSPSRVVATVRLGVALGLGALANPAMSWLIPVVVAWIGLIRRGGQRELKPAALCGLIALTCIAPATLHNGRASGDFILVAGHGGLTFAHGNSERSDGTYFPVPGVSTGAQQDLDLLRVASAELGRPATWGEADAHFRGLGLRFWSQHPGRALALTARKVWWFCAGRNYGDSYVPALEVEAGFANLLALAPLPVAWFVVPGFLGLFLLARRDRRGWPLLIAALGVAATNIVFFYSPRYRLPAVPLLVLGSVVLVGCAFEHGARFSRRSVIAALFAVSIAVGPIQEHFGFDRLEPLRGMFASNLGTAWLAEGNQAQAEAALRRAVEAGVGIARGPLAEILRSRGDVEGAIELLSRGGGPIAEDSFARRTLGISLAQAGRTAEARRVLEHMLADYPNDVGALGTLGNVALAEESPNEALEHFDRALTIDPRAADVLFNRGVAARALGRESDAIASWRRALESNPRLVAARFQLLDDAVTNGRWNEAITLAHEGRELDREHRWLASWLAWLYATVPDATLRDGETALAIAQELVRGDTKVETEMLDTLAAAFAELGRFDEAVATADRAITLLREDGENELAAEIEARAKLYRARTPFRLSAQMQ